MNTKLAAAIAAMILSSAAFADARQDLLAQYAAAGAGPFSAARGEALHNTRFSGGKDKTPSCATCHGEDVRRPGRTLSGKVIKPAALSATPDRYSKVAKVEKWFRRNCKEVMGRQCTPQEKGDWLTFVFNQ